MVWIRRAIGHLSWHSWLWARIIPDNPAATAQRSGKLPTRRRSPHTAVLARLVPGAVAGADGALRFNPKDRQGLRHRRRPVPGPDRGSRILAWIDGIDLAIVARCLWPLWPAGVDVSAFGSTDAPGLRDVGEGITVKSGRPERPRVVSELRLTEKGLAGPSGPAGTTPGSAPTRALVRRPSRCPAPLPPPNPESHPAHTARPVRAAARSPAPLRAREQEDGPCSRSIMLLP